MQPTLLILAAGMGSRYGGLKQVDRFGPSGETIVEYSIYDALRAGFGKIVMVVRREFVNDFREFLLKRALKKADIRFVFQELDKLPAGFSLPSDRVKPWGTGHAVMMAEDEIDTPFAVINADDFYGAESYLIINDFLSAKPAGNTEEYCIVGYQLDNTLSESGSVSRGVCKVNQEGYLTDIHEHKQICRSGNQITGMREDLGQVVFTGKEPVSMNLIGFRPSMFDHLNTLFAGFLTKNSDRNDAEFYIPFAMNEVIKSGDVQVKVLHTHEKWFGVTYREDREMVINSFKELVDNGVYPADLWK
jgi:UTP-glucose-1-phosphate uridylyltransferase